MATQNLALRNSEITADSDLFPDKITDSLISDAFFISRKDNFQFHAKSTLKLSAMISRK